jgi:hypothetical protein
VGGRRRGTARRPGRLLGPWLVLLAFGAPAAAQPPAVDVPFIISEAQRVQQADVEAWTRYRFRRRAERQEIGGSNEVLARDSRDFLVTPVEDGFDEELVGLDGREPSRREKERHGGAGSFSKHYRRLRAGAGGEEAEGGYSLGLLLHLSSYRFAGLEVRDGVACYRLDFFPDDGRPKGSGLAWKVISAMQGSLWIATEGFHLAAARAGTIRPIPFALSLGKVHEVQVSLESQPVGEGVWLPRRIEMLTRARILVKSIRRRSLYTYSDFVRLPPA